MNNIFRYLDKFGHTQISFASNIVKINYLIYHAFVNKLLLP